MLFLISTIKVKYFLKSIYRELIASFNKITRLPVEMGKLRRLRKLYLNNNRIKNLPNEIGSMEMLEEFVVSENMIEELPVSIARIPNLKVLRLTNNRLRFIPYELANILTLEEFDCGNNPNLESVPAKWRGDTDSLLFTCRIHRGMPLYTLFIHIVQITICIII
jgi:Leucine-rich repeat (LRR) protein